MLQASRLAAIMVQADMTSAVVRRNIRYGDQHSISLIVCISSTALTGSLRQESPLWCNMTNHSDGVDFTQQQQPSSFPTERAGGISESGL